MSSLAAHAGSSANGIVWDLSDLYAGTDDPRLEADLAEAQRRAEAFEGTYRGRINVPGGPAPEFLLGAVQELESLYEQIDRPLVYASLLHAAQTDDLPRGALLSRTRERRTRIVTHLIFFDLEWAQLPDEPASILLAHPVLTRYRHFLEQKRVWRPHLLSEPEEKILEEKNVTGRAAFVRLFDETVAAIRFPFERDGRCERLTLSQLNAKLYEPDREERRAAAEGITRGLREHARLLTFIFNNVVLDHAIDCRLRKFSDPMAPRHLANEIGGEVVTALMTAAERHYGTVERYYRLKGRLLGLEPLYDYDRYAPVFADLPTCSWDEARRIVLESYEAFSPRLGSIAREFFERRWIDAELRPGKRGGAFSASAVPSVHPYILMNYTDKLRDVTTLAHELGHGVHQYLARSVGYLQCDTPLTTAETASVFGEMLTFQALLERYSEPRTRLALLCSKIEDAFATVFRQIVLTRFEQLLHQARHERGEQTTEQINELWLQANRPMHGDAVQLTEGYAWWWLYIGHFIHVPFYCYAYAFGELLVLALVQKYRLEGAAFVPKYLDLLSAGGSAAPHELLARLGVDVTDPGFWDLGLQLLDGMVTEAEALAPRR
ncbi:MAG: M3 family oligoendopeptidase [Gemmataceae bacterium]|nr:M3 family oligoendopeptidase [Gemmataceae bacterium]MDW8264320.1 M3 family oligoendopeptidase [Gemmataceae bacterium]